VDNVPLPYSSYFKRPSGSFRLSEVLTMTKAEEDLMAWLRNAHAKP
jgi:hypothetical protein